MSWPAEPSRCRPARRGSPCVGTPRHVTAGLTLASPANALCCVLAASLLPA